MILREYRIPCLAFFYLDPFKKKPTVLVKIRKAILIFAILAKPEVTVILSGLLLELNEGIYCIQTRIPSKGIKIFRYMLLRLFYFITYLLQCFRLTEGLCSNC